jgi:hypothetical protein
VFAPGRADLTALSCNRLRYLLVSISQLRFAAVHGLSRTWLSGPSP